MLLIVAIMISVTSMGITLMACFVAAHFMTKADDYPYRVAAGVFVNLAAGASTIGFVALCVFFMALRPIFRRLAVLAATSTQTPRAG